MVKTCCAFIQHEIKFTHPELKTAQEGNGRNSDVMALLRKVLKRLREIAAPAYSILGYILVNRTTEGHQPALDALFEALHGKPPVIEYKRMREKQKQLEFRRKYAMGKQTQTRLITDI